MAENEIKTYTCPNCGAQITNTHNCEYCGSSLVQFAVHGIDVTKTGYMNDDYVFPGLKKQLEKNLKLQTEHPYSAVATEVFWEFPGGAVNPFSITRSGSLTGWSDNTPIDLESCDNGLRIVLDFCKCNDSSYACKRFNDRHDSELSKFKELDSFPLFTSHYCHSINAKDETERYGYQYALDFGEDVEGAARLVSEILTKVYGVSLESNFYMYTNVGRMIGRAREMWCKLHGYAYDANDANDDEDDEEDTSTTQNSGCMVAATALLVPAVYTVIKLLGTMLSMMKVTY